MRNLLEALFHLPGWEAACLLSLLPLLEDSTLVGIIVPGETALLLGGVLADHGRLGLAWMVCAGSIAAVIGDSIGYFVGRRPDHIAGPFRAGSAGQPAASGADRGYMG